MGFDIDFISADLFFKFLLKGLIFSVELTFIATVGGLVVGTVLALMRLSGRRWLELPATDRKSTRLNSSHMSESRMPSSA